MKLNLVVFLISLCGFSGLTAKYIDEELIKKGVTLKEGMYYCEPLGAYVRPYDNRKDVEECAYALEANKICAANPHTRWLSGRCFCPAQNIYLDENPRSDYRVKRPELNSSYATAMLKSLAMLVDACTAFTKGSTAFGRSVIVSEQDNALVIKQMIANGAWDNRDDFPGEQGNPQFPVTIASSLNIPAGFNYSDFDVLLFPTSETLNSNLAKINAGVGFYEVDGELTGRAYLEEFIKGRLPIAKIEDGGDATFFLHDMNFHVMSFLLLPRDIRELAQRQTYYLLDFIDYFSINYPSEYSKPEFKLMMQKLIEDQISRIDVATGNFSQSLFYILKKEKCFANFLKKLAVKNYDYASLHASLMWITDGNNGFCEKRSVRNFLGDKEYLVLRAFDENAREKQKFYKQALFSYIDSKSSEPTFVEEIKIDTYDDIYRQRAGHFGISAVDLLIERIRELQTPNSG